MAQVGKKARSAHVSARVEPQVAEGLRQLAQDCGESPSTTAARLIREGVESGPALASLRADIAAMRQGMEAMEGELEGIRLELGKTAKRAGQASQASMGMLAWEALGAQAFTRLQNNMHLMFNLLAQAGAFGEDSGHRIPVDAGLMRAAMELGVGGTADFIYRRLGGALSRSGIRGAQGAWHAIARQMADAGLVGDCAIAYVPPEEWFAAAEAPEPDAIDGAGRAQRKGADARRGRADAGAGAAHA